MLKFDPSKHKEAQSPSPDASSTLPASGLLTSLLAEDLQKMPRHDRNRAEITELFYQRLYRLIGHIRADISCLSEEAILRFRDAKDLNMVVDIFAVQLEEIIDNIKSDPCTHTHIRAIEGQKVCELCAMKIS